MRLGIPIVILWAIFLAGASWKVVGVSTDPAAPPAQTAQRDLPYHVFLPTVPNNRQAPIEALTQMGGRINAIAVEGQHAFVGVGPRMIVFDVSNPAEPRELAWSPILPGVVVDLAPYRGVVYIRTSGSPELTILDVHEITYPHIVGTFTTGVEVRDIVFAGDTAYACDGYGLRVMDARDPLHLVDLGALEMVEGASDCSRLDNGYLVVRSKGAAGLTLGATPGLRIIDVADVAAPKDIGGVGEGHSRQWLVSYASSGNTVYLHEHNSPMTGFGDGVRALDMTNPRAPQDRGWIYFVYKGIAAVAADQDRVFISVSDASRPLQIVDLSQPGRGTIRASLDLKGITRMVVRDHTLFASGDSFQIIDATNTDAPRRVSQYDLLGDAWHVEAAPGGLFVGQTVEGRLRAFDLPAPGVLRQRAVLNLDAWMFDTAGPDHYLLAATNTGLHVIELQPAGGLLLQALFKHPYNQRFVPAVGAAGDLAVTMFDGGTGQTAEVSVVDLRSPSGPQVIGTDQVVLPPEYLRDGIDVRVTDIVVAGDRAYIAMAPPAQAQTSTLVIEDLSQPSAPHVVSTIGLNYSAESLAVRDNLAYIAAGQAGLRIVRIEPPETPDEIGSLALPDAGAVLVEGPFAYVTDLSGTLHVIDVSDPAAPRVSSSRKIVGTPSRLALRDGILWVAAHEGGLYGFDVRGK